VRCAGPLAGECVDYTSPETEHHPTRWKRKRRDETAFINTAKNGTQYLGTTSRITGNAKEQLAFVRSRAAGLELARPKKAWKPTPASFRLLGESDLICQAHGASDAMFDILVSDYRLAGHTDKARVRGLVACHMSDADFQRAWAKEPRNVPQPTASHMSSFNASTFACQAATRLSKSANASRGNAGTRSGGNLERVLQSMRSERSEGEPRLPKSSVRPRPRCRED